MAEEIQFAYTGMGPALQEKTDDPERIEELMAKEYWEPVGEHKGYSVEELSQAAELVPRDVESNAVELEAAEGDEPSELAKRFEKSGRSTLTISPDSPRAKRWLTDSERESLRKAEQQEREEERAPEGWKSTARREFEELQRAKRMDDEDRIEALSRKLEYRSNDFSSSNTWKDNPLADDIEIETARLETIEPDELEEAETPEIKLPEGSPDELADYFEFGSGEIVIKTAHPDTIAELEALEAATITDRSDDGITAEIPEGREAIEARL